MNKEQINEAAKQYVFERYAVKNIVSVKVKLAFQEGAECALSQPKENESLSKDFETFISENTGKNLTAKDIWNFSLSRLHPKEQPKESDAVEFAEWLRVNRYKIYFVDLDEKYVKADGEEITIKELYQEYLKTKQ